MGPFTRNCPLFRRPLSRPTAVLVTAVLLFSGCAHKNGPNNLPVVVNKAELGAIRALITNYRQNPNSVTQQTRNDLVERLIGVSDDHYITLRNSLLSSRNTLDFLGEVTSTTLSAVSALIGDVDTKSILSTASTLTQSTKVSIDKAFFKSTSTEAIVAKMDALRATKQQTITTNEALDKDKWGLEAALNDVRQYDDAGTVQTALISITADAASAKTKAETELNALKISLK